jgi:hypothetical protein
MRAGLALLVFLLDTVALVSILGTSARTRRKLAWSAVVVLLPVVGAIAWLTFGRKRAAVMENA